MYYWPFVTNGEIMTNLVFVYGTLKKGFGNHRLLEQAKFGGRGYIERVKMLNLGAFPALIRGGTRAAEGEIYYINDHTLSALDRLEGHPTFYERQEAKIYPFGDEFGEHLFAWCYFLSKDSQAHYEKLCPVIEEGVWNGRRA